MQTADETPGSPDLEQTLRWLECERQQVYKNPDASLLEWSKKLRQKHFRLVSKSNQLQKRNMSSERTGI